MMTLEQAEALAAATLAKIPPPTFSAPSEAVLRHRVADRERVESDLAGLRKCWDWRAEGGVGPYVCRSLAPHFADGLRRTAALYGVDSNALEP